MCVVFYNPSISPEDMTPFQYTTTDLLRNKLIWNRPYKAMYVYGNTLCIHGVRYNPASPVRYISA